MEKMQAAAVAAAAESLRVIAVITAMLSRISVVQHQLLMMIRRRLEIVQPARVVMIALKTSRVAGP